jgi:hypothetical protein
MPTGGFLRTNFRRTGQQPITAIAGGFPFASYGASAGLGTGIGLTLPFGGFIMGSITDSMYVASATTSTAQSNVIVVSAFGAMSAWFGAGAYGTGYQIVPIAFIPKFIQTSFSTIESPFLWAQISGSCFQVNIGHSTSAYGASIYSIVAQWVGFITSSP